MEQWPWSLLHKRSPVCVNCDYGKIESLLKPLLSPPLLYYQPLLTSYPLGIFLPPTPQFILQDSEFHFWSITGCLMSGLRTFTRSPSPGGECANFSVLIPLIHRKSQRAPCALLSPMHGPCTQAVQSTPHFNPLSVPSSTHLLCPECQLTSPRLDFEILPTLDGPNTSYIWRRAGDWCLKFSKN